MKLFSNMKQNLLIKNQSGFTLIELLVVATIIVVLSAIGLVSFSTAGKSARNSKRKADLETVRQALVLYKSDTGTYPVLSPGTHARYENLLSTYLSPGNYISDPTPDDPKAGQNSCGTGGTSACNYTYTGTASTFTLTAPLEGETTYTLTNP